MRRCACVGRRESPVRTENGVLGDWDVGAELGAAGPARTSGRYFDRRAVLWLVCCGVWERVAPCVAPFFAASRL